MMAKLPQFVPGMHWRQVSAHELNNMVDEVKRLSGLVDDLVRRSGTQTTPKTTGEIIVALVEKPTNESKMLAVRRIRYASIPPQTGEYEWDWTQIDVYPAYGYTCMDYAPYYVDPSHGAPPADTIFLRAERRQGVWILHPPIRMGTGSAVVIRGYGDAGALGYSLRVQRIVLPDNGSEWLVTGDAFTMPTMPLTPAIFWRHRILPDESQPLEAGDIQPTQIIDGVECVALYTPLYAVESRSDDPYRGPRPVIS